MDGHVLCRFVIIVTTNYYLQNSHNMWQQYILLAADAVHLSSQRVSDLSREPSDKNNFKNCATVFI